MNPKIVISVKILGRYCKAVLPERMYLTLRSTAIRIIVGEQTVVTVTPIGLSFPLSSSIRFINCKGDVLEKISITKNGVPSQPHFAFPERVRCNLVLCCAFTGRHRVLRHSIRESFAANSKVCWLLVGSTNEDFNFIKALAKTTGRVAGFICEDKPLGRKWQSCLTFAGLYYDSMLFGITGSDDIVSNRLLDHVVGRHRSNIDKEVEASFLPSMYATIEWLVVLADDSRVPCPQVLRCCYSYDAVFQPLGAGRFYTQAFLTDVGFRIFDPTLNRLLDDRGYFLVRSQGGLIDYYTINDGPLVSVKGNWVQLNDVNDLLSAPQLDLREYSFEGYNLLQNSLLRSTLTYLFRPGRISPQLNFSSPELGIDYEHHAKASDN